MKLTGNVHFDEVHNKSRSRSFSRSYSRSYSRSNGGTVFSKRI